MICIVGAGIVGCASAYRLAQAGHPVMLLDAAPGPGLGCSLANGAQLSYSYVEPLATPATLRALPRLLLQRASPVRFRPTLDWRQYAWSLQFLAACRDGQVRATTRRLLQLSARSRDTLAQWQRDGVLPDSYRRNGKLVLCPDAATWARQRRQMAFQATLGSEQDALSLAQCLDREPALLEAVRRAPRAWVGGIWTPGECVVDTHALCRALVARVQALGGQVRYGTRVTGFVRGRREVQAVATAQGEIRCDALVLAAGSESARLAQALGDYLPVYPIKGYSLTLDLADAVQAPRVSVTDLGRKTVFAPLGGGALRVAAAAEIGGHALDLDAGRALQMREAVAAVYPGLTDPHAPGQPWAGLRPATPTSMPIVRRTKRYANAYVNVGHGALGLTLAAGCAAVLEEVMASP